MNSKVMWRGRQVIENLAEIYQQLYLAPGEESENLYPQIVRRGQPAPVRTLTHFHLSDSDICELLTTPAGDVMAVTLSDRSDFETFIRIMSEKCCPVAVPTTQGALIIDGVINHTKIKNYKENFYCENPDSTWFEWELAKDTFLADKKNYTDIIIALSVGLYSAIPAEQTGFTEDLWKKYSQIIRMYHECTHFVCRRLFPDKIDKIWDEIIADAVGIYAALGKYDIRLAEIVFGINHGRYTGGRLENYLSADIMKNDDDMNHLLYKIQKVMSAVYAISAEKPLTDPFELAVLSERKKEELWDM